MKICHDCNDKNEAKGFRVIVPAIDCQNCGNGYHMPIVESDHMVKVGR